MPIPVTHEEGMAMFNKAEEYRTDEEYKYSLYEENCGMVAQYILEAGEKSFAMSDWKSSDEQNAIVSILGSQVLGKLVESRNATAETASDYYSIGKLNREIRI